MNPIINLSVTILLILLITSILSVQSPLFISALTIGDINLDELAQLEELEFLKGPKGDMGDPGPTGPPGPPGPDKSLEVITVSKTETASGGSTNTPVVISAMVECPVQTKVTGGGYDFNENHEGHSGTTIVFENGPFNNGWKVSAEASVPYPVELTAYATCSQLTNSTLR